MKLSLPWKSYKYCIFLWVGVCVRACVREGVCVGVGVGVDARAMACVCTRVALLIQHAICRHIAICSPSISTKFIYSTSQTTQFSEKVTGSKIRILIFSTIFI
jgi:hypothetical protein